MVAWEAYLWLYLKGTVSRDFVAVYFCSKDPKWTKSILRSFQLFCLRPSNPLFLFFKYSIAVGYLKIPKKHYLNCCIVVFTYSMTTQTPCSHIQWLRRHHVHKVNDYADTMSAQSTAMLTACLHSLRLIWHHVSIVNDYVALANTIQIKFVLTICVQVINNCADTVSSWSLTMLAPCLWRQRQCWHCVLVVIDYADTVSS